MEEFLSAFLSVYQHPWVLVGILVEAFIIMLIIICFTFFKNSGFTIFFDMIFEKIYDFFEDLLWIGEKRGPKVFITSLFFIVLFSNLLWVFLEFLLPIFWENFEHYIKIPTADINFNIGMAITSLSFVLFEQMKHLGFFHFIYEYFPIFWKNYIPFERGKLPKYIDIPLWLLVKIFDIIISVFLWLLEMVGLLAKIISLSFRLFWNITSWWVLLVMIISAISWLTVSLLNFKFPIIIPLLVYIQEIMVALIQAFVFPLLVAIFIKVAKLH
jgi:F0F1-type ATP synthase membrane subunit a